LFSINLKKANPDKFQAIAIGKKTNKHKLTFNLNGNNITCEDRKELIPELKLVVPFTHLIPITVITSNLNTLNIMISVKRSKNDFSNIEKKNSQLYRS
jgi:hypothetical protein